nr:hypothetical protein [Lachnospiraceae bacterium]
MKKNKKIIKKMIFGISAITAFLILTGVFFNGSVLNVGIKPIPAVASGGSLGMAFEPGRGYSFEEKIAPGKTTHIRTLIKQDLDSEEESRFDSFGLEASDERITVSGLTLSFTTQKAQYYPDTNNTYRNNYSRFGEYFLDFDVSCAENLDPQEYTITFYGVTLYDQAGLIPSTITASDVIRPYKTPLIVYTVTSTDASKAATVKIENITYDKTKTSPKNSNAFSVKITNTGKIDASEIYIDATLGSMLSPEYEMKKLRVGSLKAGETTVFKVPFSVNAGAEDGTTMVTFNVSGVDKYGKNVTEISESIFVTIGDGTEVPAEDIPVLSISTKQNYKLLKPGTEETLRVKITNNGTKKATKVRLMCTNGLGVADGLTKEYTSDYIEVADIEPGKTVSVDVPFKVNNDFKVGIHELSFSVKYKDSKKHEYTSDNMTMYVQHYKTGEVAEADSYSYLQISGVTQSPSSPMAGQKVTVSFNVKNQGTENIKDLQFYATGLSAAGFQPVSGEPYQSEGNLDAGESKKVTMSFMAGEDIPNGVNSIGIGYNYFNSKYEVKSSSTTIYVLNVVNHKFDEVDVGRPKIIVSDYSTEPEILRAGETFDFSYTLKNTHTGKEARNIKITLSQADGVIAPAQGTNIFYIDKLDPTQEVVLSLPLKSRADTVTGDYAVVLKLEYEYDDMSEVDKEHGGVSEENTLKIRVIENYRPVIENIFIDAYQ